MDNGKQWFFGCVGVLLGVLGTLQADPWVPFSGLLEKEEAHLFGLSQERLLSSLQTPAAPVLRDQEVAAQLATQVVRPDRAAILAHRYPVSQLVFTYAKDHRDHPPIDKAKHLFVTLGKTDGGYTAPTAGIPDVTLDLRLDNTFPKGTWFDGSALRLIGQSIVEYLADQKILGVYVRVSPQQIDNRGQDLRPLDQASLDFVVTTLEVGKVQASARESSSANYQRIADESPLQGADAKNAQEGDLLRSEILNDYIYFLNRYPNRRVDVSIDPLGGGNQAIVDYLVTEKKPWRAYAGISNTGAEGMNKWVENIGFVTTQLTNHDDTLAVDASSDSFDNYYSWGVTYHAPLFGLPRWRWLINANQNRFTSAELGIEKYDFTGMQTAVRAELKYNFYQHKDAFYDAFASLQYRNVHTDNHKIPIQQKQKFLIPMLGLQFQQLRPASQVTALFEVQRNVQGYAGQKDHEALELGRVNVDNDWTLLSWQSYNSFYVEPLIDRWFGKNKGSPATYIHEAILNFCGQYAFDYRLFPQIQSVVGGLYTVRGYPQDYTAGDSTFYATAEYACHFPRALAPVGTPKHRLFGKPFRYAPEEPGGLTDWDFIIRSFFDFGRVINNKREIYEHDVSLLGTGLGAELVIWNNFFLRADWGVALKEAPGVTKRSQQWYLSMTFVY